MTVNLASLPSFVGVVGATAGVKSPTCLILCDSNTFLCVAIDTCNKIPKLSLPFFLWLIGISRGLTTSGDFGDPVSSKFYKKKTIKKYKKKQKRPKKIHAFAVLLAL